MSDLMKPRRSLRKRALAGKAAPIIIGVVAVLLVGAVAFPLVAQARESAKLEECRKNMQIVGDAIVAYAKDNNGILGDEMYYIDSWARKIDKYVPEYGEVPPFCAGLDGEYYGLGVGYALNPKFYNKKIDSPELATEPLLIETRDLMPSNQWLEDSRAGRRHLRGTKFNKYYVGRGAVTEDTPKNEAPAPEATADMPNMPGGGRE